ncbi:MAG: hypothetical protein HYX47_17805 [Burkholderiales bacterium]|nr:hypothetical protein [Burkholderiales bacterium]
MLGFKTFAPTRATTVRLERVSRPWQNWFVAAYTTAVDGSFYGYAKIFAGPPRDTWSSAALAKVGSAFGYANEEYALEEAECRALLALGCLDRAGANFVRHPSPRTVTQLMRGLRPRLAAGARRISPYPESSGT